MAVRAGSVCLSVCLSVSQSVSLSVFLSPANGTHHETRRVCLSVWGSGCGVALFYSIENLATPPRYCESSAPLGSLSPLPAGLWRRREKREGRGEKRVGERGDSLAWPALGPQGRSKGFSGVKVAGPGFGRARLNLLPRYLLVCALPRARRALREPKPQFARQR